jgi:hypothetical protein
MGCDRGFSLAAKYPGKANKRRRRGNCDPDLQRPQDVQGQFEVPIEVQQPVPMNLATTFRQIYLGYLQPRSRVLTKEWNAKKARILNMLDAKGPITISAERQS